MRMTLTAVLIWGEVRRQVEEDRLVLENQAFAGHPGVFAFKFGLLGTLSWPEIFLK